MKTGKVYLVGAGPGDASLLTIRADEVLKKAAVVLYDSLVGDAILSGIPDGCRKIGVGKRAGRHSVPQSETNRLIIEEAEKGNCVVRLKGGDPFLFGRGGEELEGLAEKGIPFEIVPGITSPIAVPAYNGIPVTHRGFASSLHIITAHRKEGSAETLDFSSLAQMEGTLVFLMGAAALAEICGGLIRAGKDPETPAAILESGTTAAQRRVTATLRTLPEKSRQAEIGTPAIILVGGVCALAERFEWAEKRPLAGEKILLMRPRHLIREFAGRLRDRGAEVLEIPLIDTVLIPDNRPLDAALDRIGSYDWIVFTSPTGVRLFFEKLAERRLDLRALAGCRFAVIGEGSRRELEARGIYADLIPEQYHAGALGQALAAECSRGRREDVAVVPEQTDSAIPQGQKDAAVRSGVVSAEEARKQVRILIPRARKGSRELTEALAAFTVDDIPLYETRSLKPEILDVADRVENGGITMAVFTSASMVRSFAEAAQGIELIAVRAACIGEQTAAAARSFGMQVSVAGKASLESLEELILEMHAESRGIS